MWKKIVLIFLCLAIGFVLGGIVGGTYFISDMAKCMFMFQEKEIYAIGQAAEKAYYNGPNEVAIWALENYVNTLSELKKERGNSKTQNPYLLILPDTDLMIAHARLAKLYQRINNIEKSKHHLEQAISCSKNSKLGGFSTEKDFSKMLDALDKSYNENLEKQQ